MPPKRDEAALQEEEELQLAIALSQSEAEEKERMVCTDTDTDRLWMTTSWPLYMTFALPPFLCCSQSQRQKGSYGVYPKADPTPVTSSAPPVSTLYSSPVVRASTPPTGGQRNAKHPPVSHNSTVFYMRHVVLPHVWDVLFKWICLALHV